jgi:hypothetical protein
MLRLAILHFYASFHDGTEKLRTTLGRLESGRLRFLTEGGLLKLEDARPR